MNSFDILQLDIDPFKILNITPETPDKKIKELYFEKIAKITDQNEKEKLKKAFQLVRKEEDRIKINLLQPYLKREPEQVIDSLRIKPSYTGPGAWYELIRSTRC